MAENHEISHSENDTNQQEIKNAQKEVDKALENLSEEAKKEQGERIKKELKENETNARELKDQHKKGQMTKEQLEKAASVKVALVKALRAVEKKVIILPLKSVNLLKLIVEEDIAGKLTDSSSPCIFNLINTAINGEINNSNFPYFLQEIVLSGIKDNLALTNSLANVFKKVAGEFGQSEEVIKNIFGEFSKTKEQQENERFESEWVHYNMGTFFNEEQKIVIKALNSPENFAELVDYETTNYIKNNKLNGFKDLKSEHFQKINEEVRDKIIIVFGSIFRSVNESNVKEFFEHIVSAGFMDSPQSFQTRLQRKLETLITSFDALDEEKKPNKLKNFEFYRQKFINKKVDRVVSEGGSERIVSAIEPVAMTKPDHCSVQDFIRSTLVEIGHEVEWTEYMHNIGALMTKSAGKDGFWPQIAAYADKMGATDLDGIMSLPDGDVINAAYRLYTKYLQGEFAKYNWIHQPNMFGTDAQSNKTPLQEKIINDLKMMFPHLQGKEQYRILRAMTMGLGLAQGVFITEQEIAAWADPNVTSNKGKATFRSYYTNDNAALNALNPMHQFLRWQSDGAMKGPILFALVSGIESKFFESWDHKRIFDEAKKLEAAWNKGECAFDRKDNPNKRTLMELLLNISRVGSHITRGGWSILPEIEALCVHEKNGAREKDSLDILKSFRSIEYIGIDAMMAFIKEYVKDGILVPEDALTLLKDAQGKDTAAKIKNVLQESLRLSDSTDSKTGEKIKSRDVFLQHIFRKYIIGEKKGKDLPSRSEFDKSKNKYLYDELEKYIDSSIAEIDNLIKIGSFSNYDVKTKINDKEYFINTREQAILTEVFRKFVFRGVVGAMQERIPSKFLLMDRSRTSKDGIRVWEKIAKELQKEEGKTDLRLDQIMDERLQDLMMVEAKLREETTKDLKKYQEEKFVENVMTDFSEFNKDNRPIFEINEEIIKNKLEVMLVNDAKLNAIAQKIRKENPTFNDEEINKEVEKIKDQRIKDTLALYKAIMNHCTRDYVLEMTNKIRPDNAVGNLKNKYMPFDLAPEELENSLMAWRASGEKILKRRLGDIGGSETAVYTNLDKFIKSLNSVAVGEKHDFKPLIESIGAIKGFIEGINGKDYGQKVAHDLAMMAIAYYRKDTIADTLITSPLRIGAKNSLAAEFAGQYVPVWEWGRKEIDAFINELSKEGILPREPFDLSKPAAYETRAFKLFGNKLFEYKVRKPDVEYYGGKIRNSIGATLKQMMVLETGFSTLPMIIFLFILLSLKKGLEEMGGGGKK